METVTLAALQLRAGENLAVAVPPHPHCGKPMYAYPYGGTGGEIYLICRFETRDGRKDFRPFLIEDGSEARLRGQWGLTPNRPRPLYRHNHLGGHADRPVIVVEGEKCVERTLAVLTGHDVTTSMNGAQGAKGSDWGALAGRTIWICPDFDEPGKAYAAVVRREVRRCGATEIKVVDPIPLVQAYQALTGSQAHPKGLDLADFIDAGATEELVRNALIDGVRDGDVTRSTEPRLDTRYTLREDGLYVRLNRSGPKELRIASPVKVVARGRDHDGRGWAVLVDIQDPDRRWHRCTIPCESFGGAGNEYLRELLSLGLRVAGPREVRLLRQYLVDSDVDKRVRIVCRPGWYGEIYIRGSEVYGNPGSEAVVIGREVPTYLEFQRRGTLLDWQNNVARYAVGNSRLGFVISMTLGAFISPLINRSGVGVNLVGSSSVGKTTALYVAASVVSCPAPDGLVRTWRATDNALEGVCEGSNDGPLFLDELGQVGGDIASEVVYMIANGEGKKRGRAAGGLRDTAAWHVDFLSTGEVPLAQKLEETRRSVKAGQSVRFIDLPAAVGKFGAVECLHGYSSPRDLIDSLKESSLKYFGTAGYKWLVYLTANKSEIIKRVTERCGEFVSTVCPQEANGQVLRVATTFALAAAAGDIAIEQGILPWPSEEGTRCALACYAAWRKQRGSCQSGEVDAGIRRLVACIQLHGRSRFEDCDDHTPEKSVYDRIGWRRRVEGNDEFIFTRDALQREVKLQDTQFYELTQHMAQQGWLPRADDGRAMSLTRRLPGMSKTVRVYVVSADVLSFADDGAAP